jgi:hypothetical protein
MGIIKRLGQAITDIGERTERASASSLSGIGNRNRSHTLRRKIDTLRVPKVNVVDSSDGISVRTDAPEPIVIPTSAPQLEEDMREATVSSTSPSMNSNAGEGGEFASMLDYYEGKKSSEQKIKRDYLDDGLQFLNS